jgi:heme/copper-type cytochrome/quinol oxidase subunit 1
MKISHRRWTLFVVAVWVLALGLTTVLAPVPAEAKVVRVGWMVYTPNHPNGCAPLAYDCYVIDLDPD